MVELITANDVVADCGRTLGVNENNKALLDEALLGALARHSAGVNCPCSRATLKSSLIECTRGLPSNFDSISQEIDNTLEALIVGGDLLELADVSVDDSTIKSTWIFAAPPSFVLRRSGSAFLFGIVQDQQTLLPQQLATRLKQSRYTRVLEPQQDEDLARVLRDIGLQQISESAWLKCPQKQSADAVIHSFEQQLKEYATTTEIEDLQILESSRPVMHYLRRWKPCTNEDGWFVARYSQEFGSPVWCLVELHDGNPVHLLNLPNEKSRWRGCDWAWFIQAAIDSRNGKPQQYRRRIQNKEVRFDFFSPLPLWSERRLMIFGTRVPNDECLFSYVVSREESEIEETFLQQNMWMSRSRDSINEI